MNYLNQLLLLCLTSLICFTSITSAKGLEVYIIGGTGNLAKLYLWKGFFNLFRANPDKEMYFYGAGKSQLPSSESDHGLTPFQKTVLHSLNCGNMSTCGNDAKKFISRVKYKMLHTEKQYKEMCDGIKMSSNDVIIYLSMPPVAYDKILRMAATHCDIGNKNRTYKFAFEKPFGTDLESASLLSDRLKMYLEESQIYRVDHYLGKDTVHQILNFRKKNPELEQVMNRDYVKGIEVAVTETVGCEGRISYYEASGAIRDMLQNHLTEILCLLTMDVSKKYAKLNILQGIQTLHKWDISIAQYRSYLSEVIKEINKNHSNTPTFATARMKILNSKWRGVPVRLSSGKRMDERNGFGRVIFKRKHFMGINVVQGCEYAIPQIVFMIRHNNFPTPAILVSKSLPLRSRYLPEGWEKNTDYDDFKIFGTKGKCFRIFTPKKPQDAYSYLITKLHEGDKQLFVPLESLIESWRIWSPIVKSEQSEQVQLYDEGSSLSEILRHFFKFVKQKCLVRNILFMMCDLYVD